MSPENSFVFSYSSVEREGDNRDFYTRPGYNFCDISIAAKRKVFLIKELRYGIEFIVKNS